MELRVERDELYRAVSRVQSIIEKRSNMPILSTVLLTAEDSGIVLSATDLEISFQQKFPAEVLKPGSLAISGRKLFEILKESKSSTVYIKEKENNWAFISDEKAKFNLACLSPDEYPVLVEPEDVPPCGHSGGCPARDGLQDDLCRDHGGRRLQVVRDLCGKDITGGEDIPSHGGDGRTSPVHDR